MEGEGGGGFEKGCVTFEFLGWFCRLFIFLGVKGASSKTFKTGSELLAGITEKEEEERCSCLRNRQRRRGRGLDFNVTTF